MSIQGRARSSPGGQNHGLDEASGVLPGVGGGGGVTGGDLAHCALAAVGRTVAVPTQVRLRPAAVAPGSSAGRFVRSSRGRPGRHLLQQADDDMSGVYVLGAVGGLGGSVAYVLALTLCGTG